MTEKDQRVVKRVVPIAIFLPKIFLVSVDIVNSETIIRMVKIVLTTIGNIFFLSLLGNMITKDNLKII